MSTSSSQDPLSLSLELKAAAERWISLPLPACLKEEIQALVQAQDSVELSKRLLAPLSFGTAGVRAPMGEGFSYLNDYTVTQITYGLSKFLEEKNPKKKQTVILGYDSRHNSLKFAHMAAKTLLHQGFSVVTFSIPTPSPILAYATRFYKACAGIMMTASHNPKEDNGYKVFSATGGQFSSSETQEIYQKIKNAPEIAWTEIQNSSLEDLQTTDIQMLLSYFQEVKTQIPNFHTLAEYTSIVYSPLMGTGKYYAEEMIKFLGGKLQVVEEENRYDGNFLSSIPPNPEIRGTFEKAIALAEQKGTPICIVTDPDADRIGLWEKGTFFNGNELGVLMAFFLLEHQLHKRDKVIMSSIVSTQLVKDIAVYWGCSYKQTPTGFKYIGSMIEQNPEKFLFGFEESGGYLMGPYIQDKDAIGALALVFTMANYLYAQGKNFTSYLEEIHSCVGFFQTQNIEVLLSPEKTKEFLLEIENEHTNIFNEKISEDQDFQTQKKFKNGQEEDFSEEWKLLPVMDLRIFYLEYHLRLAIRPSGTESKLKFYLELFIPSEKDIKKEQRKELLEKFHTLKFRIQNLNSF